MAVYFHCTIPLDSELLMVRTKFYLSCTSVLKIGPDFLCILHSIYKYLKIFYVFIFRQKGRGKEREGEKHQCVVASRAPPTGDLACNPGMCPNWELNWRPFGLQASTQSFGPHQPGLHVIFLSYIDYINKCLYIQMALCVCGVCIDRFNQLWMENIQGK